MKNIERMHKAIEAFKKLGEVFARGRISVKGLENAVGSVKRPSGSFNVFSEKKGFHQ